MARSSARPPAPAPRPADPSAPVAVVTDRTLVADAFGALLREQGIETAPPPWVLDDLAGPRRRRAATFLVLVAAATVGHDADALHATFEREAETPIAVVILDDVAACAPPLLAAGCTVVLPPTAPSVMLSGAVAAAATGERLVHPEVLAVALGGLRGGSPRGARELTPRELDVLRLLAAGRTNASIGADLGVAASTVKTHVASLLDKLDANDRAHAVAIAMRAGLIT